MESERETDWNESLTIGIPIIDQQHKALLSVFRSFYEGLGSTIDAEVVSEFMNDVRPLLETHFETEEAVMKKLGMDSIEFDRHRTEHVNLINEYVNHTLKLMNLTDLQMDDLIQTGRRWVLDHILEYDLNIRNYCAT